MQRDYDPVEGLLEMWADQQIRQRPSSDVPGYPTEASGGFIVSWRKDEEEQAEQADQERIVKVNTAYSNLHRRYQVAIDLHYGLARNGPDVWRYYNPSNFEEAKIMIRLKMIQVGGLL